MSLSDIRRAIADENDRMDAAHAAVAEAREALERAQADLERAELAERETIVRSKSRIVALEAAAATFGEEHAETALHNRHGRATVNDTMNTDTTSTAVRGRRLKSKHLAAVRIRAIDGSIGAFATKHKVPVTTVRSWYAKGEAAREIPPKWAAKLAKAPYSIPPDAWTNGIATDED